MEKNQQSLKDLWEDIKRSIFLISISEGDNEAKNFSRNNGQLFPNKNEFSFKKFQEHQAGII